MERNMNLSDIEAQVLEQILETVQQLYTTIGHDEWSVHGEDAAPNLDAEQAVESMLVQLQCGEQE